MLKAIITYKNRKTKQIYLGHPLLNTPEILFTNEIAQITIYGKEGQFALFITNGILK